MNSTTQVTGLRMMAGAIRRMIATTRPSTTAMSVPSTVASRVILNALQKQREDGGGVVPVPP